MTLKLVVKSEAYSGPEELLLCEKSYGIGRLHDNDVCIQNDCVSGYHAELQRTPDGGYTISDLKSTNGTFLNGNRVTSPERVKPGDRLKLGNLLITLEEHVEVVTRPEHESFPGGVHSKVVSLKDIFGFQTGENFNTYPITPVRIPPAPGNVSEVPKPPVRMEEAVQGSGPAPQEIERAQQIERAKEAERAQQIARAQEIERAKEAERLQEIERAKEAERLQQIARAQEIERAKEADRLQQIERAKEAERLQQIERAKEAERLQQIERAKEAERMQQIERAKEAERLQQIERAKEAERLQQIERAKEAERLQQIERAKEAERAQQIAHAQQIERAKEAERAQQIARAQQIERAREAERAQQIERAKEAERVQQIERAREAERAQQLARAREAERLQQIERAKEAERAQQLERAREAERAQQLERAREAEGAREAERAREIARAKAAERAEVDLRERPEPAGSEDFRSKIQSLTAQLESAMREISRLSAFIARESPRPVEMNGGSAAVVNPGQPLASSREAPATPRPETSDGRVVPTGPAQVVHEGDREEVRAGNHTPPPLPGQNSGNEVAFGVVRKPPILSTAQLRQQLEAARSAAKRFFGDEAGPRGNHAGRV